MSWDMYFLVCMGAYSFSFLLGAIIGTIHALFYKACDLNLLIKFLIVLSYGYIFGLKEM